MKTPIYVKMFVGLVAFGTLVALTVYPVADADHLKNLCEACLIGLGVMHMGGDPPK